MQNYLITLDVDPPARNAIKTRVTTFILINMMINIEKYKVEQGEDNRAGFPRIESGPLQILQIITLSQN